MKALKLLASVLLIAGFHARADQYSYTNDVGTVIPDANPAGLTDTIPVPDLGGWITNVTLSLTVSGGYTGDLYASLTHDSGYTVLLNRVGRCSTNLVGYEGVGLNLTLDDFAPGDVHMSGDNPGMPLTGIWQPDGRTNSPSEVLDIDLRLAMFDSFRNLVPEGDWTLFIADFNSEGEGILEQWRLNIDVVPEPSGVSLSLLALGAGWLLLARRRGNSTIHGRGF